MNYLRAALLGLLFVSVSVADDWPQILGPARNGISGESGLITTWPKDGAKILWNKDVGAGYSGPVVVGDQLILFQRVGADEVIESLDPATGKRKWKTAYACDYQDMYGKGDGPRSTPVVAGERIYTLGAGGDLTALKLADGAKVWQRNILKDYKVRQNFFGVGTTPIVEDGLVIVNVGGKGAGIVAFDAATGAEKWKATDDGASYSSPVAATIGGERLVFVFTRQGLVALDPKTGKVRFSKFWRSRQDASVNAAAPTVWGDLVFVTTSYRTGGLLLKVTKEGAEEVWKNDESLSAHYNTPILKDGYLYGIDGRQETGARLRCIDFKTGKEQWTKEGFGCASMILAGTHIYALTEAGELVCFEASPKAYRETARAEVLGKPCRAEIALAGGRLFARDNDKLVCISLKK
ncbi:MAG: PQQ-binding-like beta-propeller repeat protein [Gemmataceae bacterium]